MLEKEKIDAMFGESKSKNSNVNHPSHYADGRKYEPIDVIWDWNLDFCLGNTIKYISRAGRKDPDKILEDLKKAKFYLDYYINQIEINGKCFKDKNE